MNLRECLMSSRELAQLCSQNGWIDNDTLRYEVLDESPTAVTAAVEFEEIVMEGAGCVAARVPCYGRVRIHLNAKGEAQGLKVL